MEDLVTKLSDIRHNQFEEKRDLEDVRNVLKTSPGFSKMVRNVIIKFLIAITFNVLFYFLKTSNMKNIMAKMLL